MVNAWKTVGFPFIPSLAYLANVPAMVMVRIPLYILLEIGFSTLSFLVLVVLNFSANSSNWIGIILRFEITDPTTYSILAKSGHWLPISLNTLWDLEHGLPEATVLR